MEQPGIGRGGPVVIWDAGAVHPGGSQAKETELALGDLCDCLEWPDYGIGGKTGRGTDKSIEAIMGVGQCVHRQVEPERHGEKHRAAIDGGIP